MTYSLLSTATVGFDLVRLPQGEQVAQVLLVALGAPRERLAALADVHPGAERRARWQQVRAADRRESVSGTLHLAGPAIDLAAAGEHQASTSVLRRIERAAVGDVEALDRLVRHDVLDWSWIHSGEVGVQDPALALAADVLVDAAASAYCAEHLPDPVRRRLVAPYLTARLPEPGACDVDHPPAAAALRTLGDGGSAARDAWRLAVDAARTDAASWAPAMHEATWAVHLSGRTRLAAAVQLHAVAAFRRAGFTATDGAYGVWNAVSGALQAVVVQDLLSRDLTDRLLRPWHAVHGEHPGT